jgi:hypothetical protein
MSSVLEVGLWPYVGLGSHQIVNEQIRRSSASKALFASQALLYDSIVIPTSDFGIISALIDWLSLRAVREALDNESIKFILYPGMICYGGNGAGVMACVSFGRGASQTWDWTQAAAFGDLAEAIEAQVRYGCDNVPDSESLSLILALSRAAAVFDTAGDFGQNISKSTYADIINDAGLKNDMGRFLGFRDMDLNKLPGPEPNQLRFYNGLQVSKDGNEIVSPYRPPQDAIDLTLAIAQLNIQVAIASSLEDCDLSTFDSAVRLLEGKLRRAGTKWINQALSSVFQLPGVPDVRGAVAEGRLDPSSLWVARDTPNAREFRKWLKAANAADNRELARLYVGSLRERGLVETLPVKALRWALLTTAAAVGARQAGVLGEIAAAAAAGVDSIFLEKWLSGWTPALFIDELRQIRIEPPPLL